MGADTSSTLLGMLPPPKRKLPSTGLGGKMGLTTPGQGLGLASRPAVASADNDDDAPAFVPKVVKKKANENLDLFGLCEYQYHSFPLSPLLAATSLQILSPFFLIPTFVVPLFLPPRSPSLLISSAVSVS